MILLGLAADPLAVCAHLPPKSWSLNTLERKTGVFIGLNAFTGLRQPSVPNRVLIFDNRERAESLAGLIYLPEIDPLKAAHRVRLHTATIERTQVRSRDFIAEMIEKHKDRSVIHLYNTYIYGIKFQPTRNAIKDIYLAFWNGEIDRTEFDSRMHARYPKRGETKEAVDRLMALTKSPAFANLQSALQEIRATGRDNVLEVAAKYKIEPFDINYVVANKA